MKKTLQTKHKEIIVDACTVTELGMFPENALLSDENFVFRMCKQVGGNPWELKGYKSETIGDYVFQFKEGFFGKLETITLAGQKVSLDLPESHEEFTHYGQGIYVDSGYAVVILGDEKILMDEDQQLIITSEILKHKNLEILGEGQIIKSTALYTVEEKAEKITENHSTKATFDDYKYGLKLTLTDFRGANKIVKSLRDEWRDKELREGIKKVDKFYINYLIFIIVGVVIALVGSEFLSTPALVGAIIIWLIISVVVISPLVYLYFIPKPVSNHVKKFSEMSEYERAVAEEEINKNEKIEKLLKKYKLSGSKKYIE
ncbi:MAG: hypothetical protein RSA49_00675 [Anaerovoracaceae bacterium]